MKILKIFGVVVGIHLFALILIFANPGCSSTTKNIPAPSDTVTAQPPPSVSVPLAPTGISVPENAALTVPTGFNPDAAAVAAGGSPGVRFNPTRPGTPAATTLAPAPVADVTPATTYTVQNGDNLWSVSKKFKQTTAQIAAANNLKTNAVLRPGQKLIIPGKATTPGTVGLAAEPAPAAASTAPRAAEAAAVKSGETVKHVVRPGESLSMIAQQYGVRQGDIAVANNIADPQKIRAGMELTITGWQPAGKSGKSSRSSGKSAPAVGAPKSIIPTEPEPAAAPAATAPQIPIIRIDDSPIAPAPKSP